MHKLYPILLLIGFAFNACQKEDIEHEKRFDRSYEAWLNFKAASGNSYRYEASGATWTGSSWLTTITVKQGRVVQRDFHYKTFNSVWMPETGWDDASLNELLKGLGPVTEELLEQEGHTFIETLQWTEAESELGIHESSPASRIQTLDEIYQTARTQWLKKRDDAQVSFEANNNGMISSAGFVPNGCMDDCFSGISIQSIEALD